MKKQAYNPYLPSYEYIPDGEPYVFGDRVYVYGSHDYFNCRVFCQGDYVCWSAPVDDLGNWRYEGVIFRKDQDPINTDGRMNLFAPDVTVGPDGRYYLYYVYDKVNYVSVLYAILLQDSMSSTDMFTMKTEQSLDRRRGMNHSLTPELSQ